jgi:hypothetical protein
MPGMGSGLGAGNPTVVAAFKSALLYQGLVALAIAVAVVTAWQLLRLLELRPTDAPIGVLFRRDAGRGAQARSEARVRAI